jgi:hypothetical protein
MLSRGQPGIPLGFIWDVAIPSFNPGEFTSSDVLGRGEADAALIVASDPVLQLQSTGPRSSEGDQYHRTRPKTFGNSQDRQSGLYHIHLWHQRTRVPFTAWTISRFRCDLPLTHLIAAITTSLKAIENKIRANINLKRSTPG